MSYILSRCKCFSLVLAWINYWKSSRCCWATSNESQIYAWLTNWEIINVLISSIIKALENITLRKWYLVTILHQTPFFNRFPFLLILKVNVPKYWEQMRDNNACPQFLQSVNTILLVYTLRRHVYVMRERFWNTTGNNVESYMYTKIENNL